MGKLIFQKCILFSTDINRITLLGRVGTDPSFKDTSNGRPMAAFILATNENFKDSSGTWPNKKKSVFRVTGVNISGRVGIQIFFNIFFFWKKI